MNVEVKESVFPVQKLMNIKIVVESPTYKMQEISPCMMEEWAKEFEEFIRDHRSLTYSDLTIERKIIEVCSYCGNEWETDKDVGGLYCGRCGRDARKKNKEISNRK